MNTKRGFTLVELLMVIAIASVLMAAFFGSLVSSTRSHEKLSAMEVVQSDFDSILLSFETDSARAGFLSTDPEAATWFSINWPSSLPSIEVQHQSNGDKVTFRWAAAGADCPSAAEYSVTLPSGNTGCIRSVSYYVDDGVLTRDLDEAGPVGIGLFTTEAFNVFFRDDTGSWSSTLPPAQSLRAVAAYIRVSAPYEGDAGCGTYPHSEVIASYGNASDLGITTVTYSTCKDVVRLERVVSTALPNQQWY